MKRYLLPVMLIVAVCLLAGCSGPTESRPDEFVIVDGVVTGYTGKASEIVIPDGVTAIGKEVFKGSRINSVVIPDSCTQIMGQAFLDCKKLTRVVLPDNGISLGPQCFYNCTAIKEINIPESAVFYHTPFSYTADFHDIVPSPGWFMIPTSPNPTSTLTLISMHKTETGLLRLTFHQGSGNKIPVTINATEGTVQINPEAGFSVTLKLPDGSTVKSTASEVTLNLEEKEYLFTFDFETDVRPAEIILDSTRKTVVLNGTSWAEYESWENH